METVQTEKAIPARRLWWEGFRCGLVNLFAVPSLTRLRHTVRLLLCPVDLWRYHEYRAVLGAYRGEREVLDVASPKLMALVLARWYGARVVATDIVDRIITECTLCQRATPEETILPGIFDATCMPLADESFSFVYSVSVLEHIADDGDARAAAEIARVLKPGGRTVITVPLVPMAREIWLDWDPCGRQARDAAGKTFFCRLYDWEGLHNRIVKPSGLHVKGVCAWSETRDGWYEWYNRCTRRPASIRSILTKLLDVYWAAARLEQVSSTPPEPSGHAVVALTLEKPC